MRDIDPAPNPICLFDTDASLLKNSAEDLPIILNDDIEVVLAPQEALGKSVLQSSAEAIALLDAHRNPTTIMKKFATSISEARHTLGSDTVDTIPLLKRIEARVHGCQVVAAYDIRDFAKISLLLLKVLAKINGYVGGKWSGYG